MMVLNYFSTVFLLGFLWPVESYTTSPYHYNGVGARVNSLATPPGPMATMKTTMPQYNPQRYPFLLMAESRDDDVVDVVDIMKNVVDDDNDKKWSLSSLSSTTSFVTMATIVSVATCMLLNNEPAYAAASAAASTTTTTLSTIPSTLLGAFTNTAWLNKFSETGFYQAFSLVFLSEIGDKTFFIAGLLAMKTSRFLSFIASTSALAIMTVISVVIGQIFHAVPSGFAEGIPLDDIAAVAAFAFFGFKTLKEALEMDDDEEEGGELADAQEDVDKFSISTGFARVFASIFGLVFAAEFGDRSFLSTIALSAAQNPIAVTGGAVFAHAIATFIAVSGGAYVAKYISEKVIGIIGGTLFLVFAATTAFGIF